MNPAPQLLPRRRGGGVRGGKDKCGKISIILLLCDALRVVGFLAREMY